ncbi:NUDIX domain-containing protein [Neorhizobium sp. P12A]|uniref:NUDIX domain-containing protein n=1 Tax=Neorhizobium sp. P12A TaxID=2268027 RepID=UPI0011F085E3|nr:NUDIX domain-containing protein [Neorhizobium sp. P12A]
MPKSRRLLAELTRVRFAHPTDVQHQVSAVCHRVYPATNDLEVLLITTRECHRWTLPKDRPMSGKASHDAAKQEALEEAGIKGKVSKRIFGRFTFVKMTR